MFFWLFKSKAKTFRFKYRNNEQQEWTYFAVRANNEQDAVRNANKRFKQLKQHGQTKASTYYKA